MRAGNRMKTKLLRHFVLTLAALLSLLGAGGLRAATFTWDGGAADNFLTSGLNWAGNIAPGNVVPGHDLVFPSGLITDRLATNPVAGLASIGNVLFTGTNYELHGGAVILAGGITNLSGGNATVRLPLTLLGSQRFLAENNSQLTCSGALALDGYNLTLNSGTATNRISMSGPITGLGNLILRGSGQVTLAGHNSIQGLILIPEGGLELQVIANPTAADVIIINPPPPTRSSLRIYADVPRLLATNAVVSVQFPTVPGPASQCDGLIISDSSLVFQALSNVVTSLRVNGPVILDQPALALGTLLSNPTNFFPDDGAAFTLIDNDGTDPVVGTFAGLPEGSLFTELGQTFHITYLGGDGNDVVLVNTAPAPVSGLVRIWTGNGDDEFWSNATNWFLKVKPQPGDSVRFDGDSASTAVTNDFAPGLSLSRLQFRRAPFTNAGHALLTSGDIHFMNDFGPGGTIEVRTPLTLTAPQTWDIGPDQKVNIHALETLGHTVTLRSAESALTLVPPVLLLGPLTGTGEILIASNSMVRIQGTNSFSGTGRVRKGGDLTLRGEQLNLTGVADDGGRLFLHDARVGPVEGRLGGTVQVTSRPLISSNGAVVVGPLTMQPGSTLYLLATPDKRFTVHGPVTLAGAIGEFSCTTPGVLPGQTLFLIDNQSGAPINGTLAGVAEGGTLVSDDQFFRISYVGGDGNDLTATLLPPAWSGFDKVWDGGAAGPAEQSRWANYDNWVGDLGAFSGDTLIFPVAASRKVNTNDTFFQSGKGPYALRFLGGHYDLATRPTFPPMPITAGIFATNNNLTNILRFPIATYGNQPWNVASPTAVMRHVADPARGSGEAYVVGEGSVTKTGPGLWSIEGLRLEHTGATFVSGGTLRLKNRAEFTDSVLRLTGGTLDAHLASAPQLIATGGRLRLGGQLADLVNPAPADSLEISGDVLFDPAATFSPVASGTNYLAGVTNGFCGRLVFNKGRLDLAGAALQLELQYSPRQGDQLLLALDLDEGGGNITNTFAGLPEGALYQTGPFRFTITYSALTNRAIVLTALTRAPVILLVELKNGLDATITGEAEPNRTVRVEWTTDFNGWTPLGTVPVSNTGGWEIEHPNAAQLPHRFYRAVGL